MKIHFGVHPRMGLRGRNCVMDICGPAHAFTKIRSLYLAFDPAKNISILIVIIKTTIREGNELLILFILVPVTFWMKFMIL